MTTQTQAASSNQIQNAAGGYTFRVSPWDHLDRFLLLGIEGGTFYVSQQTLLMESVSMLSNVFYQDAARAIQQIVEVSQAGRAIKNDFAVFALAFALAMGSEEAKRLVEPAFLKVVRTGTHLFQFCDYYKKLGGGWGRRPKRIVSSFYKQEPERVSYQVSKYRSRAGWNHRDVLRHTHTHVQGESQNVLRWAARGWEGALPSTGDGYSPSMRRIWALERAKEASIGELLRLIEEERLTHEMIPTEHKGNPDVQRMLLRHMPLGARIRNLGAYTKSGVYTKDSQETQRLVEILADDAALQRARIHPMAILGALKTYASGGGYRSSASWKPVRDIVDALDKAFPRCFPNVEATGKRILVGLDVSGSMNSPVAGMQHLSCREAASAYCSILSNTETICDVVGFTARSYNDRRAAALTPIPTKGKTIEEITNFVSRLRFGATDCSLPILNALEHGQEYDAFIIMTDNETYAGRVQPHEALRRYRARTGIPAKMVVSAMSASCNTIADPHDRGMLDVVGVDTSTFGVIADFLR